jgi:Domain of unknown function (DUF4276)
MTRLHVIAEGLTEVNFVSQLLKPHLENRAPGSVAVSAPILGGHYTYAGLKKFAKNLLGSPGSDVVVTTMIDLFKVAGDFPGLSDPADAGPPFDRVRHLEERCREDLDDSRFLPYISNCTNSRRCCFPILGRSQNKRPKRRREIRKLAERLDREFASPEHVNRLQPPSYRICAACPEYQKTTDGILAATKIGLPKMRERRRHFGEWLDRLEGVGG